jgi:hypothetical protein
MSATVMTVSAFVCASEQLTDPVFCPLADLLHVEKTVTRNAMTQAAEGLLVPLHREHVPWNLIAIDGTNPPETEERASKPNV